MTPAGLAQLKSDEGYRKFMYSDKSGKYVSAQVQDGGNPTIGYGWNLLTGCSEPLASVILNYFLDTNRATIAQHWPDFPQWPSAIWQDVAEMIQYNTGDVFGWLMFKSQIDQRNKAGIAQQVRNSLPWLSNNKSGGLHDRYERMAVAIENDSWTGPALT
jgi:hypothetical protein